MNLLLGAVGVLALASALGVITCRNTVYSALSLVGNVASLAVVYLLLNAQFLFAVQLIIYAGAVVVLFIFIIALLNPEREDRPAVDGRLGVGVLGVVIVTAGMVLLATNGITTNREGFRGAQVGSARGGEECGPAAPTRCQDPYHAFGFNPNEVNGPSAGNVQTTGGQLFTTFLLPFEITSLLLLVAAVGAVYLTRRPRDNERPGATAMAARGRAQPRRPVGRDGTSAGEHRRLPPPVGELPGERVLAPGGWGSETVGHGSRREGRGPRGSAGRPGDEL